MWSARLTPRRDQSTELELTKICVQLNIVVWCVFASTLCKYDLKKVNLFVLGSTSEPVEYFFCGVYRWWWCVYFIILQGVW